MQQPCSSITHLSSSSYDLLMEEEMSHPRKEKTRRRRHSDEDGRKSRKHKVAPSHGAAPQGASSRASSSFCLSSVAQAPGTESTRTPEAGSSRRVLAERTGVPTAPPRRADASGEQPGGAGALETLAFRSDLSGTAEHQMK